MEARRRRARDVAHHASETVGTLQHQNEESRGKHAVENGDDNENLQKFFRHELCLCAEGAGCVARGGHGTTLTNECL